MCNPKLSIITATYNVVSKKQQRYFYEMFLSVHKQTYKNIEHIIVDGGSTDGSVEFIQKVIQKYAVKEVKFLSEPDKGINDATNKGAKISTGDYLTLMCDDDFYTREYSVSKMMDQLQKEHADYVYADSWWLDKDIWVGDDSSFAYRHPFLINAFIFKKSMIKDEPYLDLKYPMVGDYDLFLRILKKENVKGCKVSDILTVLRPGGYSQSNQTQYKKETDEILAKHFGLRFIFKPSLFKSLHVKMPSPLLLLKIKRCCKNKKLKESVLNYFTFERCKRRYISKLEHLLFLKCITKYFRINKKERERQEQLEKENKIKFYTAESRKWIDTFDSNSLEEL